MLVEEVGEAHLKKADTYHARPRNNRHRPDSLAIGPIAEWDGERSERMFDELKRYWFVVAVFRDPTDLVATARQLRSGELTGNDLLVIAGNGAEGISKRIDGRNGDAVHVALAKLPGGQIDGGNISSFSPGLDAMLCRLEASGASTGTDGGSGDNRGRSQIYTQLLQDVADGAVVLVANVAGPVQQLWGARIALRGNCECVLTHEIADGAF